MSLGRRSRSLALASGLTLLVLAGGCRRPTVPPAPSAAIPAPATGVTATAAVSLTALAPSEAISLTLEIVGFRSGMDVRPGPWSPSGEALVAYAVVRDSSLTGPVGRVWTVNTAAVQPLWDSGDVEGPIRGPDMAAWLADGTLVLARRDGMRVRADGSRVDEVAGLEGQPRAVSVAPNGRAVFVNGPDASWLVGYDSVARAVVDRPKAGFDAWSWRPDSNVLGLSVRGGDYFVLDVATGVASKVAEAPSAGGGEQLPPPRWLSDGRLFLSAATQVRHEGGLAFDHRLVDRVTTSATPVSQLIGIPPNPWLPADGSTWVSPDGRLLVYPEYTLSGDAGNAVLEASWLYDVAAGQARKIEPVADPVWGPSGERFAYRKDDRLALWHVASDTSLVLTDGASPIMRYEWSPDGRWLLYEDGDGLWIASGDGRSGPEKVADQVVWEPGPTWSIDGSRFAATLSDGSEVPQLSLVTVQ